MQRLVNFKYLLASLLSLAFVQTSNAQLGNLSMVSSATPAIDTVIENSVGAINGSVQNIDSLTFIGNIFVQLELEVQGTFQFFDTLFIDSVALLNGQTVGFSFNNIIYNPASGFPPGLHNMRMFAFSPGIAESDTLNFQIAVIPDPIQLLELDLGNLVYPDSMPLNSVQDFPFEITNNSIVDITSPLQIYMGLEKDTGISHLDTISFGLFALLSNETQQLVYTGIPISYAKGFEDGGNIVVIWPEAPTGAPANDSLKIPVFVSDQIASIGDPIHADQPFGVFPNPTSGAVFVVAEAQPQLLEVFDANGRLVARVARTNALDLTGLPKGVYAIRATLGNGESHTQRLVKH